MVFAEESAEFEPEALAHCIEFRAGLWGNFFRNGMVVIEVGRADERKARSRVDKAFHATGNCGAECVVRSHCVHAKSNFAMGALNRAVDDDVHALCSGHDLSKIGYIDLPRVVRCIDGHEVGDAKLVVVFEGFDDIRTEKTVATEDEDVHGIIG